MSDTQTNGKENTYVDSQQHGHHQDHGSVEGQQHQHQNQEQAKMPDLSRQVSVQFSPEQFADLYLQPNVRSGKQLSSIKSLGNPTPVGIICFVLALLPTSCVLMNFRQTSSLTHLIGLLPVHYMVGGLGMVLAGVGEFLVGNSFPMMVFSTFGFFWLSLGFFLDPQYEIAKTLGDSFAVPFSFYFQVWGVFCLILTIASLKTNMVLVLILLTVTLTFFCLGSAYMKLADGDHSSGVNILKAAGGCGFTASVIGLYLMLNLALSTTEFPYLVPLFDLSHIWKKRD